MLNFKKKKTSPKDNFKTFKNLNLNEIKYEEIWSDPIQPSGKPSYKVDVIRKKCICLKPLNIIPFTTRKNFIEHYGLSESELTLGKVDFVMEFDTTIFTEIDNVDELFKYKQSYDFHFGSTDRYAHPRPTIDLIVSESYEGCSSSRISFSYLMCSFLKRHGDIWLVGFSMDNAFWNLIDYSCPRWFRFLQHDSNKPFVRELKFWNASADEQNDIE